MVAMVPPPRDPGELFYRAPGPRLSPCHPDGSSPGIDYQPAVNNNRSITNHSPRTAFVLSDWLFARCSVSQSSLKSVTATFLICCLTGHASPPPLSLRLSPLFSLLCLSLQSRHLSSRRDNYYQHYEGSHFLSFLSSRLHQNARITAMVATGMSPHSVPS